MDEFATKAMATRACGYHRKARQVRAIGTHLLGLNQRYEPSGVKWRHTTEDRQKRQEEVIIQLNQ